MASQVQLTQKLIKSQLSKWAARQPNRAHYDSRGGRDSAQTTGLIIGSQTSVDCSYCVVNTEVDYTPPAPPE
ncbi:hypothetical protein [Neorhizobium tomejilense]|uniref:hypothetical protein n=1 Tax=Neorhizobium tomejilense TaxID=2093828 RepID=UPI003ED11626